MTQNQNSVVPEGLICSVSTKLNLKDKNRLCLSSGIVLRAEGTHGYVSRRRSVDP